MATKLTPPPWLAEGMKLLGLKEGRGKANNPKVVALYADAGHPEVKDDAVAWCAAFVGACLKRAGKTGTGTLWALDYGKWGVKLDGPAYGAIAYKRRAGGGGHVAFVVAASKQFVWVLGGNQGDSVSVVRYAREAWLGFRWPPGSVPQPAPTSYSAKALTSASEA